MRSLQTTQNVTWFGPNYTNGVPEYNERRSRGVRNTEFARDISSTIVISRCAQMDEKWYKENVLPIADQTKVILVETPNRGSKRYAVNNNNAVFFNDRQNWVYVNWKETPVDLSFLKTEEYEANMN